MKKIYVIGGWGYGNIGDEAILEGLLAGIKSVHKDAQITVSSYNPVFTEEFHEEVFGNDIRVVTSLHRLCRIRNIQDILFVAKCMYYFIMLLLFSKYNIKDKRLGNLIDSDLVIFGGGGYFNTLWKEQFIIKIVEILFATSSNAKVVIAGQTAGPFYGKYKTGLLKRALKRLDKIMVRDTTSIDVLNSLGFEDISLGADNALLIEKANCIKGDYIAVTIQEYRGYISKNGLENKLLTEEEYLTKMKNLVQELSGFIKVKIIPSSLGDSDVARTIYNSVKGNCEYIDTNVLTYSEFISVLQGSKLCLSTNMHPLIISSVNYVPVVGLSPWYKVDDFLSTLGCKEYCFRVDDFHNETVVNLVKNICMTAEVSKKTRIEELVRLSRSSLESTIEI